MSGDHDHALPPLEWLRVFEAAARHGSFTAAAAEIGLTQAAVSQRIGALEARLGVPLFHRLPRGVQLTADGEAYAPHVREAMINLRRSTADLFGAPRRRVTIAAPASVATLWIAPRLTDLASTRPDLDISLSSIHRMRDYDATDADYQVRFGTGDWPGFEAISVYREELVPACSPDLLKSTDGGDWRGLPTLAVKGARDGWAEWAAVQGGGPLRSPRLRFDSFITALEAAISGAGVVLASRPLCRQAFDVGSIVPLTDTPHVMVAGTWLIWRETRPKTRDHDLLVETVCRPG